MILERWEYVYYFAKCSKGYLLFFHPLRLILTGVLAREGQINSYCESQNLNIYNTTHLPFFIVWGEA